MKQKKDLRKEYLQKRAALSVQEVDQLNYGLVQQFKAYPLTGMRFVHFFLPIQKFREPNTLPIIHWILQKHPEINIVLSRSNLETNLMEHFLWDGHEALQSNRWGIEEPKGGTKVLSQQIDAVIVPLLAFDQEGNRVGFGKGFYDRFLADCKKDCKKIGMSFFPPIDQILDMDIHDAKLDACISSTHTYFFLK